MLNQNSKQDAVYPRTASQLEQKHDFDKRFAEVMGVATDAQKSVEELTGISSALIKSVDGLTLRTKAVENGLTKTEAELSAKIGRDENDQIISMINAAADVIRILSNRLQIQSDNFELSEDGAVTAKNITITDGDIKISFSDAESASETLINSKEFAVSTRRSTGYTHKLKCFGDRLVFESPDNSTVASKIAIAYAASSGDVSFYPTEIQLPEPIGFLTTYLSNLSSKVSTLEKNNSYLESRILALENYIQSL